MKKLCIFTQTFAAPGDDIVPDAESLHWLFGASLGFRGLNVTLGYELHLNIMESAFSILATRHITLPEDEILAHLETTGHPALSMEPMI